MANSLTFGQLHWLDILVIGLYYAGSLGIGVYSICKTRNNLNSVFLAGRSLTWWPIGMSLFASNIGSINFVGIAGSGAASGLAVVQFEWSAVYLLIALGWIFVPVYMTSGIYTIPEYLHKRFGGQRLRVYLSIIALLTYVFAILSVDLYSGALFIQHTLGWNIYIVGPNPSFYKARTSQMVKLTGPENFETSHDKRQSALKTKSYWPHLFRPKKGPLDMRVIGVTIILGTTFVFTILGGLMTVVLTDAFAVIVMVSGGLLLFILGMIKIEGFSELKRRYNLAIPNVTLENTTCGYPREDAFHIFRDSLNADFPGLGTILRTTFGSMWFFCSNQLIVQRSMAAKNIKHAKAGSILAAYLKLTPMLIMVVPGMISRALYPDEVACGTPETCEQICGNRAGCSNIAFPKLAVELLPNGLRGLLIAAMLAAVISSLTSIYNSSCSIVTIDIWKRIRPNAKQRELMIVSKVFVVILVAISIVWIPTMQNAEGGQIYRYAVASVGLFGGPTCGVFLMAILCTRVNEKGAFWGLLIGQAWGILRFVLDAVFPAPPCGETDTRPIFLRYWHVFYHVISQIIITILISLLVSLLTKPLDASKLKGTTFWTRFQKAEDGHSIQNVQLEDKMCCLTDTNESKNVDQEKSLKNEQDVKMDPMIVDADDNINTVLPKTEKSTSKNTLLFKCFHFLFKGNRSFLKSLDDPDRLDVLKQNTFWTVVLNLNAFVVVALVTCLYIVFR